MFNRVNKVFNHTFNRVISTFYPRKIMFSVDYPSTYGNRWHVVYPDSRIVHPKPRGFGSIEIDFRKKLEDRFPSMGVIELEGAVVLGSSGWIFDQQGHFHPDLSWYGRNVKEIPVVPRIIPRGRALRGTTLSLATDFCVGSYGHFVYDVIPRLHLFFEAGFGFEDVDQILLPKPTKGHAEWLLNQLEIPTDKAVWIDEEPCLRMERLIATSFPGTRRNYPTWVPRFIQRHFIGETQALQRRRLYVSRRGFCRNPSNLQAVEELLVRLGFEIYDPVISPNPHMDFLEAQMVVGGSGSNLTGLIFCQPRTKVLELISEDHVFPYYYSICNVADLDYSFLPCKSERYRGQDAWGPSKSDYYVDLIELENAVLAMLGCGPCN